MTGRVESADLMDLERFVRAVILHDDIELLPCWYGTDFDALLPPLSVRHEITGKSVRYLSEGGEEFVLYPYKRSGYALTQGRSQEWRTSFSSRSSRRVSRFLVLLMKTHGVWRHFQVKLSKNAKSFLRLDTRCNVPLPEPPISKGGSALLAPVVEREIGKNTDETYPENMFA